MTTVPRNRLSARPDAPRYDHPEPAALPLAAALRRAGQALDRTGRAVQLAELDSAAAADLAGAAVGDLVRALVLAVSAAARQDPTGAPVALPLPGVDQ